MSIKSQRIARITFAQQSHSRSLLTTTLTTTRNQPSGILRRRRGYILENLKPPTKEPQSQSTE
jgi:hypothetical protein